jgi:uncharacterized membrane protein YcaP (DUF421 family)
MDAVIRASGVYVFLIVLFRIAGKRSLAEITTFDFVLLLIISEATQQAMLGEDFSVTNCFLIVATLVGLDIALSLVKRRWQKFEALLEGLPLILVKDGELMKDRMYRSRVDEDDILEAARRLQGLARMDQIAYAVLERNGGITVIPKDKISTE